MWFICGYLWIAIPYAKLYAKRPGKVHIVRGPHPRALLQMCRYEGLCSVFSRGIHGQKQCSDNEGKPLPSGFSSQLAANFTKS